MMRLWYTESEIDEAKQEAQRAVDQMNAELPFYVRGDVKIRMAWKREMQGSTAALSDRETVVTYIPEAELLFDDVVIRRELLDFILLDMLKLEMKAMSRGLTPRDERGIRNADSGCM